MSLFIKIISLYNPIHFLPFGTPSYWRSQHYLLELHPAVISLSEAPSLCHTMMTSSNGNIFRVTGPLCGEFTGPGEFPTQRPVTRSFDVFFDLRPNKQLSKQPRGWWFETPPWSLWRQCNTHTATAWSLAFETTFILGILFSFVGGTDSRLLVPSKDMIIRGYVELDRPFENYWHSTYRHYIPSWRRIHGVFEYNSKICPIWFCVTN